jgi:acyl carrier protein
MIMNAALVSAVRNVIARHFQIESDRLLDEARFADLGADWLDRIELLIVIDDQVAKFSFKNVVAEQIETVGDLMRLVEDAGRPDGALNGARRSQLNEASNKRA